MPGHDGTRRAKLKNDDLEFLENVRALAIGIERRLDAMAYYVDDEDELDLWTEAKKGAQKIRKMTIEEEKRQRLERSEGGETMK